MKNIKTMDYDKLVKLSGEVLTLEEMEELQEHELVKWFENLGKSGVYKDRNWWDVVIEVEGEDLKARIDVYTKKEVGIWEFDNCTVKLKEFDYDLKEFDVIVKDEVIATITPENLEQMESIIADLDSGIDPDGWEDGKGNTIRL